MAARDADTLDRLFAALADPTRRAMVERLAKAGRMAISDLAAPLTMSLPAVLKHVGVLTEAGLVSRVKVGRTVYCGLAPTQLGVALTWLRKYEGYQPPADGGAIATARGGATRPASRRATPVRGKQPAAAKNARKAAPRSAGRPAATRRRSAAAVAVAAPKAKTPARRGKAAAPQSSVTKSPMAKSPAAKRDARTVAGPRRRPVKSPAPRGRPRR
jgi:DNA-binding transcriptional ArsR family regulator